MKKNVQSGAALGNESHAPGEIVRGKMGHRAFLKGANMITLKQCLTIFFLFLTLTIAPAVSHSKGILEILREKGVITEEEYRQAIEEAQGKDKQIVQEAKTEAKAEASKQSKLPDWLNRTSFFGDIRYRHEGFYHSELQANIPTRNRERIRARLGLGVDVNEELSGKLRIVTGDANDPISTNQTLSELFTRKPINLDWAFITISPWQTIGLDKLTGSEKPMASVTAGKFPVPMFAPGNSELVFDGDLSPEGGVRRHYALGSTHRICAQLQNYRPLMVDKGSQQ